ncbi:hypothetical protein MED134_08926 [Dokdonia sp. MED134]|uniref:outer membrane beta-barrel protein n=1 Tax=Dokdonia sp. MED134 TaxID=313590 RepID=UPI000068D007|nr:outer membrane beta-barrel protein [Dokdonia sp. MED134]EAQ39602.1 hypothetical protein MED134_08926 [Dokdonia sp. MED134]
MKEKKNIDRLFQEKFKNFEAHPSERVWADIVKNQKKDNRRVIPLWWKVGGIAAGLVLLFGLGTLLLPSDSTEATPLVNQDTITTQSETNQSVVKNSIDTREQQTSDQTTITSKEQVIAATNSSQRNSQTKSNITTTSNASGLKSGKISRSNSKINTSPLSNESNGLIAYSDVNNTTTSSTEKKATTTNQVTKDQKTTIGKEDNPTTVAANETVHTKEKDLVEEAKQIELNKEENTVALEEENTNSSRWDVGAVAAPVYYGDFGGSGLDKQFADNDKSGDVNLSYGVQVSYAISPKLKIRTGVNNVDLSYNTNDISFSTNSLGRTLRGVNYSDNAKTIAIADNSTAQNNFNTDGAIPNIGVTANGSLQQQLSYLEVPLEAIYVITDKRVGVSLVGGVSTLFLSDNEVILKSNELSTNLGTASGVNDVSFTTNIGIGLDYKMTDKVIFNIEPSLKYQLNSFDNTVVDFQPYYIGVYTGVSYKF